MLTRCLIDKVFDKTIGINCARNRNTGKRMRLKSWDICQVTVDESLYFRPQSICRILLFRRNSPGRNNIVGVYLEIWYR